MLDTIFKNRINLFIFSFIFFSFGSFGISLLPPDEAKYVDAALRMIETHNYIVPFFNCHIRFDKPILYYLELVLSYKLFFVEHLIRIGRDPLGIIEYASRLPSVISASIIMVFTYSISLKLFNKKEYAINSSISLISFFFYYYLTRAVYPDASLIAFELAGIYFFMINRYIIAWIFVALAFLVKGPIGIVTIGITYMLYLWIVEKKSILKELVSVYNIVGFLVFLIISMPWYIAMYHYYGLEFINKFLIYHNIERFTGKAHQHPQPFLYYIPIIIGMLFLWYGYLKQLFNLIDIKNKKNIFLILWFVWVVIFFSISRNKLMHYIAISFVPLSILFGRYLDDLVNTKRIAASMFLFDMLLGIGAGIYAYTQQLYYLVYTAFFGISIMAAFNFLKKPRSVIFSKALILTALISIILLQFELYRPEKRIWKILIKNKNIPVYLYRINNASLIAYTRRCMDRINNESVLNALKKPYYLYTRKRYIKEVKSANIIFYAKDKGKNSVFLLVR